MVRFQSDSDTRAVLELLDENVRAKQRLCSACTDLAAYDWLTGWLVTGQVELYCTLGPCRWQDMVLYTVQVELSF